MGLSALVGYVITNGFKKQWFCATSAADGLPSGFPNTIKPDPGHVPSSIIANKEGGKQDFITMASSAWDPTCMK